MHITKQGLFKDVKDFLFSGHVAAFIDLSFRRNLVLICLIFIIEKLPVH